MTNPDRGLVRHPRRSPRDVPAEEAAELKRRHDAGEPFSSLMDGFDGSYRTLRAVLEEAGATFRGRPRTPAAPPELLEAYAGGMSIEDAAKHCALSVTMTHRMLERAEVEMRPPGRPRKG